MAQLLMNSATARLAALNRRHGHFADRTIWTADYSDILRSLNKIKVPRR